MYFIPSAVCRSKLNFKCIRTLSSEPFKSFVSESKQFYEIEAHNRRYFYLIDTRGRLYLEESKHRNYATCLKDKSFLNFFYKQLRPNDTNLYTDKPYISPCGKELNFVTVDDPIAPLVFGELMAVPNEIGTIKHMLTLGGSNIQQVFNPLDLTIFTSTGRIYHTIHGHKNLESKLGLLHPEVAETLSSSLSTIGGEYKLKWGGQDYVIKHNE